jgi:HSP20 family molecular chaperone IbpA
MEQKKENYVIRIRKYYQFDRHIELKFYVEFPNTLLYLQVNF